MAVGFGEARREVYDKVNSASYFRGNLLGLTAHERHQRYCRDYIAFYGNGNGNGAPSAAAAAAAGAIRTDVDALREHHRFIRTAEDDAANTWDARLAKKYYERLFREYCIGDLSRYRESKVGLRWRTQKEVVSGKGQFVCGAKGCDEAEGLCSYEVNFAYDEAGERRQALVKLRVCPSCAYRLNYRKEREYRRAGVGGEDGRKRSRQGGAGEDDEEDPMVRKAMAFVQRYAQQGGQGLTDADVERAADSVAAPPAAVAGGTSLGGGGGTVPHAGGSGGAAAGAPAGGQATLPADFSVWDAAKQVQESTVEEDFDAYFCGMFL